MLCIKCNTATNADDTSCYNCGASVKRRNRTRSRIIGAFVVLLVLGAFAAYFVLQHLNIINFDFIDNLFGGNTAIISGAESGTTYQPPTISTGDAGGETADTTTSSAATPTQTRRTEEEYHAMLSTYLAAVEAYIRINGQDNALLARTGRLYNATTSDVVTAELLMRLGFLDASFADENVHVLFLRPMDLIGFDEVELIGLTPREREQLTIFLAYQTPIGLGLYWARGNTMIFREHLNEVLTYYSSANGDVWRPTMADPIYHIVTDMIAAFHPDEQIVVRHMAVDDVHGFVAYSTLSDANTIANIIFRIDVHEDEDEDESENIGNQTEAITVLIRRPFEATRMPLVAINEVVPNFNFDLLPLYDITPTAIQFLDEDDPAFAALTGTLDAMGHSTHFISASYPFAYIITAGGQALIGQYHHLDADVPASGWSIEQITNWRTAEEIISAFEGRQPFYILWQQ